MAESTTSTVEALPFVPLVPFNGTEAKGGDSLSMDLNLWYQVWFILFYYYYHYVTQHRQSLVARGFPPQQ